MAEAHSLSTTPLSILYGRRPEAGRDPPVELTALSESCQHRSVLAVPTKKG
jgi:hypothetical protein